MPTTPLRAATVAMAVGLAASCSSTPNAASNTQAVLDAYRQSWADVVVAGDPANPDAPELRLHRSGQALDVIVAVLREYKDKGVVYRGKLELHPKVVELNGDKAKVEDCLFDHTDALDPTTNQIVKGAAQHPIVTNTTMEVIDGGWKAVTFVPENTECTPQP